MSSEEVFLKHLAQTSPFPLKIEVEKAEGSTIYDVNGKSYLDFISGIAVSNIATGTRGLLKQYSANWSNTCM